MQPIKLQLYTKSDCTLCDKAKAVLEAVAEKYPIQVEEINITKNLGLFTKYKNLIPVLEMDGRRLFVHRIHSGKLQRQLMWKRLRRWFVNKE
ncbi:MAG: glutaredoxin family protein [Bacteroidota bacterium]